MIFLGYDEIIYLHDQAIAQFGGLTGIRDYRLLESAAAQPRMKVFKKYVHKDVFLMAAAYCFHIIKNHPFVDGNKRTGLLTALVFLQENRIELEVDFDSLFNLAIAVACSELDKEQIADFFKQAHKK
jgi:death-on-curing protein